MYKKLISEVVNGENRSLPLQLHMEQKHCAPQAFYIYPVSKSDFCQEMIYD